MDTTCLSISSRALSQSPFRSRAACTTSSSEFRREWTQLRTSSLRFEPSAEESLQVAMRTNMATEAAVVEVVAVKEEVMVAEDRGRRKKKARITTSFLE